MSCSFIYTDGQRSRSLLTRYCDRIPLANAFQSQGMFYSGMPEIQYVDSRILRGDVNNACSRECDIAKR